MMGPVAAAAVSESVSVRQQTYMLNRHMKDGRVCRVEGGGEPTGGPFRLHPLEMHSTRTPTAHGRGAGLCVIL